MGDLIPIQNQQLATTQSPDIVAASEREKAHIQSMFQMAVYKPRDIQQFRFKLLENVKRPRFAELVEYSKPIGNTSIRGLSVKFADTALQIYGNIECDKRIVYDDATTRTIKVVATDYESNVCKSADVVVKKTVERKNANGRDVISSRKNSSGFETFVVVATDDEVAIKEAALVAKARRNLILELMPRDILDEARDMAIDVLRNQDAQDPKAALNKLLDAFGSIGVDPKSLAAYLGHPVDSVDKTELLDLRRIYAAINSGEARWADFIKKDESDADGDDAKPKSKSPLEKRKPKVDKPVDSEIVPDTPNDLGPVDSPLAKAIKELGAPIPEQDVLAWNSKRPAQYSDEQLVANIKAIANQIVKQ